MSTARRLTIATHIAFTGALLALGSTVAFGAVCIDPGTQEATTCEALSFVAMALAAPGGVALVTASILIAAAHRIRGRWHVTCVLLAGIAEAAGVAAFALLGVYATTLVPSEYVSGFIGEHAVHPSEAVRWIGWAIAATTCVATLLFAGVVTGVVREPRRNVRT